MTADATIDSNVLDEIAKTLALVAFGSGVGKYTTMRLVELVESTGRKVHRD